MGWPYIAQNQQSYTVSVTQIEMFFTLLTFEIGCRMNWKHKMKGGVCIWAYSEPYQKVQQVNS